MSGWKGPELFRRLPKLFYRPTSSPIVPPENHKRFPDLQNDLRFLAEVLQPEFEKCDIAALRQQNRYRRQQSILLAAGAVGAGLGAVQAAFASIAWPGVLLAVTSALSGWFVQTVERGRALQKYVDQRTRAEQLRSVYFQYVTRIDRYTGKTREEQLQADIEDILTKDLA
jgi:hypothetical protein